MKIAFAIVVAELLSSAAAFHFVTIGDWGGASVDEQHSKNQYAVAGELGR